MAGEEVFGAIDVINIQNPEFPTIDYTYSTNEFEFSDLKVVGNIVYIAGYRNESKDNKSGAIDLTNSKIIVNGRLLLEDKNWDQWNRGTLKNGTIDLKGDLQLMDVRAVGNLLIRMTGENQQSITCPMVSITHGFDYTNRAINDYYCMIPQLEIAKNGGSLKGFDYLRIHNRFNYVSGTVDFSNMVGMFGDLIMANNGYSIIPMFNPGSLVLKKLYQSNNKPPTSIWY